MIAALCLSSRLAPLLPLPLSFSSPTGTGPGMLRHPEASKIRTWPCADDHLPEGAKRSLRAFLASLEAQRSRASGRGRLALDGFRQEAEESDEKEERQKVQSCCVLCHQMWLDGCWALSASLGHASLST